jgi:hypothetical protein
MRAHAVDESQAPPLWNYGDERWRERQPKKVTHQGTESESESAISRYFVPLCYTSSVLLGLCMRRREFITLFG